MNECYGNKFILNGELQPAHLFNNSMVYEGESIYEVLKMTRGNPLFFHDHIERLESSVMHQQKKSLAGESELRKDIINLFRSDKKKVTNLKIVFNYNAGATNYIIYFIEPFYPTKAQYKTGVKGILFSGVRKDPESKVINHKLRSSISDRLILEGGYEALLVNESNLITEGSRSNIFFIKGETIVTAPEEVILNGITRKHILNICIENQIKVDLFCVKVEDISKYDAVFMTGTSPAVLPFCCIGDQQYNVSLPLISKLRKLYLIRAKESIKFFRF